MFKLDFNIIIHIYPDAYLVCLWNDKISSIMPNMSQNCVHTQLLWTAGRERDFHMAAVVTCNVDDYATTIQHKSLLSSIKQLIAN